jgi:hypothetical protein
MRILLAIMMILLTASPGFTQDRVWLGKARMFTNDKLGDGQDRWRTGSYTISMIRGDEWQGGLPPSLGELMEYRLRSEIIAPSNLLNPIIGTDRRYVGVIGLGAFTHWDEGGVEYAVGAELVVTGPQTGLGAFQDWIHQVLGMGSVQVLGSQIGNNVFPTLSSEIGHRFLLADKGVKSLSFRPFVEAQAGAETYIRLGGDFTFGPAGTADFKVRDTVTGFRNTAIKGNRPRGLSLLFGGDVAYVKSSKYLPTALGYTLQNPRIRLRAGVYHETRKSSFFYGLTWLGKEFVNQPRGQLVGSFSVRMTF